MALTVHVPVRIFASVDGREPRAVAEVNAVVDLDNPPGNQWIVQVLRDAADDVAGAA